MSRPGPPDPPFDLLDIDHVVLRVSDLEASRRFYVDVLGCVPERTVVDIGLHQFRAGARIIDLVPVGSSLGGDHPLVRRGNVDHFCLTVRPFDAGVLAAHFAAHGVVHTAVATRYGALGFRPSPLIEDPDGHMIEIKAG